MIDIEFSTTTTTFAEYNYSSGAWIERDWNGGQVYGQIRSRSKTSITVDGNTIEGDDGEPVYKMEEYDTESEEFTGQMVAAPQSGVAKWSNPPKNTNSVESAVLSMTFAEHGEELDEVYSKWSDAVNMSASQLESWADHPCSDIASRDPSAVRKRNMRLLEKDKSDWTSKDISDAKRTVSFVSRMRGQKPESPAEGGKGSCPSEWAVSLLNWAYNPFDGMPEGTPDPDTENSAGGAGLVYDDNNNVVFSEHQEQIFSAWDTLVNMTEEEMDKWESHPCSDMGVDNSEDWRDNTMMLMGQAPDGWNDESYRVANQVVAWVRMHMDDLEDDAESGGEGTCPSPMAVKMLNRGVNPFDSFPEGNPTFEAEAEAEGDTDDYGPAYDDNDEPIRVGFSASPIKNSLLDGFNEYGVRRNFGDDSKQVTSVDAIYEAMEPGPPEDRNGFRITKEFLRTLADKDYSDSPPYMMDHSEDTLSQIGFVKDVWFDETKEKLMLMARAYNTGSTIHDEIVNRLTHEPPATPGGSVGLNESYQATRNSDGEVEIVDARIEEFSTTPFPGGYDEGGLRASGSVQ